QWLSVAPSDGLNLGTGSGHFSVAAWILPPDRTEDRRGNRIFQGVFGQDRGGQSYLTLYISTDDSPPEGGRPIESEGAIWLGGGTCTVETGDMPWTAGAWQHVAATFDGTRPHGVPQQSGGGIERQR
ncbi:MAG: LamG-like jellyroll fold domain-containing protein, partial [Ardenticatenaceae bacterium]